MIYPMVPFPMTLSDPQPRFQGQGYYWWPQHIVCTADVQSVCDS